MNEFWRITLTNSSAIAAIILVIVGIIKLPLIRLKARKFYRPLLTAVTLFVYSASVVVAQVYVFSGTLQTFEFYALAGTTLLGVLTSYNVVYEGTRLKDLVHLLFNKLALLVKSTPSSKVSKLVKKYGLEQLSEIIAQYNQTTQVLTQQEQLQENTVEQK